MITPYPHSPNPHPTPKPKLKPEPKPKPKPKPTTSAHHSSHHTPHPHPASLLDTHDVPGLGDMGQEEEAEDDEGRPADGERIHISTPNPTPNFNRNLIFNRSWRASSGDTK